MAGTHTETIAATGCALQVHLDGRVDAPCLVLSHSLGSSAAMWSPQVEPLAAHFRVLRYDTRGHGRSTAPPGPYSMAQLGGDVLRLLDACGIDRATFCGLSLGGATGIWLAIHAPDRFDRFVFCNTLPWLGPPDAMLARAAGVRRDGVEPLVDATMGRWFTPEFAARDPGAVAAIRRAFLATSREGYAGCCEALAAYDERAGVPHISRPVLVLAGSDDPSPPAAAAREFAAVIPGASFVELPAAHLSNLGAAAEFNRSVLDFLRAGSASG